MAPITELWSAYSKAKNIAKDLEKPQERVLLILRAHPITNSFWLLVTAILFFLPLIFGEFLGYLNISANQQLFLIIGYYALVFSFALNKFYFWYFNIGVITNQKIVDVDAHNLLNTITTASVISNIEEVDKKSLGFWSSVFDYGDIHVETAGEIPSIEFLKVPHPSEVVEIINSNMKSYGANRGH